MLWTTLQKTVNLLLLTKTDIAGGSADRAYPLYDERVSTEPEKKR